MPETRQKYLEDHERMAATAYADHQIRESQEGRWVIMRPSVGGKGWDGVYWTEILCTYGNGLYVDGDIEPVVFRYGPEDPLARVHWMAHRKHAWDVYFREKAGIGTGGRDLLQRFDPDIAKGDLEELIEELRDGRDLSDLPAETIRQMDAVRDDAIGALRFDEDTTPEDVCRELYRVGLWEECEGLGMVPSSRMFYAHAALQRLYHLLKERGDYDEDKRPAADIQ
jgi:hypothetical protein